MTWHREPLDFFATERQYVEHLAPIWRQLPEEARGTFHVGGCEDAAAEVVRAGFKPGLGTEPWTPGVPTVVASWYDLRFTGAERPVAFVEHGAGQTYEDVVHGGWAGGEGRDRVGLFLCPSDRVAAANLARYPEARAVAVGCPKLDPWHLHKTRVDALGEQILDAYEITPAERRWIEAQGPSRWEREWRRPRVAVTFHWDCPLVPETRATWPFWWAALESLHGYAPVDVLGHAHPKVAEQLRPMWEALGVEWVPRFDDVLDRADLLVADNSSALYEFASIGRPVLALNHPSYRREVAHGLRFWRPPGLMCDDPEQLEEFVALALHDGPSIKATREVRVDEVYERPDGLAAARAAEVLLEWAGLG